MTTATATDHDLATLGGRLKYARTHCRDWMPSRRRALTQSEIADARGVTRESISAIESDKVKNINAETLDVILNFTGVHKSWLLRNDVTKAPWLSIPDALVSDPTPAADVDVDIEAASYIHAIAAQILQNTQAGIPTRMLVSTLKAAAASL